MASMTTPQWNGPLASIGHRVVARLIDTLITFVPWLTMLAVLEVGRWAGIMLGGAITGGYEILMLSATGQTIGKRVMRIRVIDADGRPPRPGQAAKRWLLPWGLGLVPYVGSILSLLVVLRIIASPDRRGGHDLVADTWVVTDQPAPYPYGNETTGDETSEDFRPESDPL
jgi:uncharacterized RDD family membrane protein YckC